MNFRKLLNEDWLHVAKIYQQGINTGNATFEQNIPDWELWNKNHLSNCRLVAEIENDIVGWAALSSVSSRCIYEGVAEVSVYVSSNLQGKNIGGQLLQKLIIESENHNIWTLQSSIFRENVASIKIHLNNGFREIGFREKVGKMNNVWRDAVLLERRSKKVGIN